MGKADRLKRGRRQRIPGMPEFPYADVFTGEEIDAALARKDRLMLLARDAVKPDGTILGIDEATLQLLMLHLALTGLDDTPDREERALIRAKRLPDQTGRYVDSVEWIPKHNDTPEARRADAEEEARRRKAAMDVHMAQMTPEAREAFDRLFKPAARQAFTAGATHAARRLTDADEETEEARGLREQAQRLREEGKL